MWNIVFELLLALLFLRESSEFLKINLFLSSGTLLFALHLLQKYNVFLALQIFHRANNEIFFV